MELGYPPLYAEVNRAIRTNDVSLIPLLGPFIRALGEITHGAETNRKQEDKIPNGKSLGIAKWNMAGVFLLFRGASLPQSVIDQWKGRVGQSVNMPSNSSCSEDLRVGL